MPAPARLGLLSLLMLVCAACASSASPTPQLTGGVVTPPPSAVATRPGATETMVIGTSAPRPTATATVPAAPTVSPDADACSGTADNKSFFAELARQVKWAVYCAVLPANWIVLTGSYQLAAGGQLTITYKGPGGVHLELQEGSYCTDGTSGCEPQVAEVGPTLYGDLTGTLFTLEPGYAVYVNPGPNPPSWAAASVDLDETTFVRLVAGLHKVLP